MTHNSLSNRKSRLFLRKSIVLLHIYLRGSPFKNLKIEQESLYFIGGNQIGDAWWITVEQAQIIKGLLEEGYSVSSGQWEIASTRAYFIAGSPISSPYNLLQPLYRAPTLKQPPYYFPQLDSICHHRDSHTGFLKHNSKHATSSYHMLQNIGLLLGKN